MKKFFSYSNRIISSLLFSFLLFTSFCSHAEPFKIYVNKKKVRSTQKQLYRTTLNTECNNSNPFYDKRYKAMCINECTEINLATITELNNAKNDIKRVMNNKLKGVNDQFIDYKNKINKLIKDSKESNDRNIVNTIEDAKSELANHVSSLPADIFASKEFQDFVENIVKARMDQEREKIKQELINELIQQR